MAVTLLCLRKNPEYKKADKYRITSTEKENLTAHWREFKVTLTCVLFGFSPSGEGSGIASDLSKKSIENVINGENVIRAYWERVVYRPLLTLANTPYWYQKRKWLSFAQVEQASNKRSQIKGSSVQAFLLFWWHWGPHVLFFTASKGSF